MFGSAGGAHPLANAKRFHLDVPMPAARAQLTRGKRARNTNHRPPVPCRFILEHAKKTPPRGIGNGFSQLAILLHVPNTQVLHAHHLVFADEAGGQFVQEIVPAVGDFFMKLGHFQTGFLPVRTAWLSTSHHPLPVGELFFIPAPIPGVFDRFACGKHYDLFQPQIDAHFLVGLGQWGNIRFHENGDEILPRSISTNRGGENAAFHLAAFGELHPSELGKFQPMAVHFDRRASVLWVVALGGVRLVRVFFAFEAGSVHRSLEEPVKRLGQLLQCVLQGG